jgi:hypothetical protein
LLKADSELSREELFEWWFGWWWLNFLSTASALRGLIPVALKELSIVSLVNTMFQAAQNNSKKSPFLTRRRP